MTPVVDGIEQKYDEQLVVKRVNADAGAGPQIMREYRIPGHPTTLIFDQQGQEVQRWLGPQSAETVEEVLGDILAE